MVIEVEDSKVVTRFLFAIEATRWAFLALLRLV